jgi:hypothetical protein
MLLAKQQTKDSQRNPALHLFNQRKVICYLKRTKKKYKEHKGRERKGVGSTADKCAATSR